MDINPLLRKYRFDKESVWREPQYFEHKGKVHGLQIDMLTRKADQSARGFRIWKHFIPWYQAVLPIP